MKLSRAAAAGWVTVFTLIGLAFRVYSLGRNSLWLDEFSSYYVTSRVSFAEMMEAHRTYEFTPPVYFIIQFFCAKLFGPTEFGIRLPVALIGTLSLPAVYLLGRDAFGRLAGVIASLLLATAFQAIYFSQEARCYSFEIFFTIVATWRLVLLLQALASGRGAARERWWYAVSASLLSLTHYYGAIFVFAQGVFWFVFVKPSASSLKEWTKSYVFVGAVFLLWMSRVAHQFKPNGGAAGLVPGANEIFDYHRWLFGSSSVYGIVSTLAIIAMIFFSARSGDPSSEKPAVFSRARMAAGILLLVFLPFVIAYAISQFRPMYSARYMAIGIGPMYALIGAAAADLIERWPRRRWLGIAAVLVFTALGVHETVVARQFYLGPKSEQVRESVEWVKSEALKRYPDAVIGTSAYLPDFINYYLDGLNVGRKVDLWMPMPDHTLLGKIPATARTVIFIVPGLNDREAPIIRNLLSLLPLKEEKLLQRASVWVFEVPQGSVKAE